MENIINVTSLLHSNPVSSASEGLLQEFTRSRSPGLLSLL